LIGKLIRKKNRYSVLGGREERGKGDGEKDMKSCRYCGAIIAVVEIRK
jgi:hypothetical protein